MTEHMFENRYDHMNPSSRVEGYTFQKKTPEVAVVMGPRHYRHPPEIRQYKFHDLKVRFIGSEAKPWFDLGEHEYAYARVRSNLPDVLAGVLVRKPWGPVSFIELTGGFETLLDDVQIINCVELYAFISRQCARVAERRAKKLVVTVYETLSHMPYHSFPPFSLNVREVAKQADNIIAITKRAEKALLQISVPPEKIRTIYPGIDTEEFSPVKSQTARETARETFRVLYVGRIDEEKGLDFLLRAFTKLAEKRKDVELWLCGISRDPELGQRIREYSKRYPVNNLGFVEHDRLAEVYRDCDVFCLPSFDRWKFGMKVWEEQFGFALVEAMATGLPIIATNCGAIPEVIGPDNFVVEQRSVEELFSALQTILSDEDLRIKISKSNICRARGYFDLEKQTMQYQSLFATLRS